MKEIRKIGLVMKSLNTDFFSAMSEGAVNYADAHPDIELLCVGTDTQTEVEKQISLMRGLIEKRVDAIVLVPIDSQKLVEVAVQAVKAGIAVVNIDIQLDAELLAKAGVAIPFLGPDNFTAAYEVGRRLARKLSKDDDVVIIEGLEGADNALQRKNGFLKAIAEKGLHVVDSRSACWETDRAELLFDDMWQKNGSIRGVFASNDAMALGALRVMERKGVFLPIVGFDNDEGMHPYIRSGRLLSTVDIFSSLMAVYGIEYALKMLAGKVKSNGVHQSPFELVPQEVL